MKHLFVPDSVWCGLKGRRRFEPFTTLDVVCECVNAGIGRGCCFIPKINTDAALSNPTSQVDKLRVNWLQKVFNSLPHFWSGHLGIWEGSDFKNERR